MPTRRPKKSHHQLEARLAERKGRTCSVVTCFAPAQKLGQYCDYHDTRNENTGDPEGWTVKWRDLKPYFLLAQSHILERQERPHITAALEWLDRLLSAGRHYEAPKDTTQRTSLWFHRLHQGGVTAEKALSLVVGMFLMRERVPRSFASDRHFCHQLVIRLFRLAPAPVKVQAWAGGQEYTIKHRVTVGTREQLGPALMKHLGPLALVLLREMAAAHERRLQEDWATAFKEPVHYPGREVPSTSTPTL